MKKRRSGSFFLFVVAYIFMWISYFIGDTGLEVANVASAIILAIYIMTD